MNIRRWFIASLLVLCVGVPFVYAQSDIEQRINELQQKVTELQGEENTLSKQINLFNSQITLSTLRIQSIRTAISRLSTEIDELANEIDRLEGVLNKRVELVLHRIPESYKRQSVSQFGILLFSQNVSDFLSRIKYISTVQAQDSANIIKLKATQNVYGERKNVREQKKNQQVALQKQLEQETAELDRKKREKQSLLDQTRDSEATYQTLLAQALAEKQAIERALIESVKVGPVKAGDPIALVGNTGYPGCSSGAHLHFEVRVNNTWVDPGGYLSSKSIADDQNGGTRTVGGGSWSWPLSDTVRITQFFGKTPWSWRYAYSGGIHTGYDMVSTTSEVIRALADGTLYSSSQACGNSSIIKIKYVDHGGGVISFYLHVQ